MDLLPQFNPDDYPDSPGYKPLLQMHTPSKVSKCETTEVSRLPSAIIYMTYDTVFNSDAAQMIKFEPRVCRRISEAKFQLIQHLTKRIKDGTFEL